MKRHQRSLVKKFVLDFFLGGMDFNHIFFKFNQMPFVNFLVQNVIEIIIHHIKYTQNYELNFQLSSLVSNMNHNLGAIQTFQYRHDSFTTVS